MNRQDRFAFKRTVFRDGNFTVIGENPAYVIFRATDQSALPPGFYLFGPIPFEAGPSTP